MYRPRETKARRAAAHRQLAHRAAARRRATQAERDSYNIVTAGAARLCDCTCHENNPLAHPDQQCICKRIARARSHRG